MKAKPKRWKGHCMMCAAWIRGEDKHCAHPKELRATGGRYAQKHKPWRWVGDE